MTLNVCQLLPDSPCMCPLHVGEGKWHELASPVLLGCSQVGPGTCMLWANVVNSSGVFGSSYVLFRLLAHFIE